MKEKLLSHLNKKVEITMLTFYMLIVCLIFDTISTIVKIVR